MEGDDVYRAGSILQRGGSSMWQATAVEAFSRSTREEDDEEALKWAALERLPTYSRLEKGILTTSKGDAKEIDINKLGYKERKDLLERLMKEDNEEFLLKLQSRIDTNDFLLLLPKILL